ncbi:MAG: ATP-binding protein [Gallionella sp.]|nr:ATP-binding protein [Gallionella sp.]
MNIQTNLKGRLRNTPLPLTSGLLPLFEAVVNSIHAIEEACSPSTEGLIRIRIDRAPVQTGLALEEDKKRRGPEPQGEILSFTITDNGIGFNDENLTAFKTLDTDHKVNKGCRGIGRLLWLKAFEKVEINSRFINAEGQLMRRSFAFDAKSGIQRESLEETSNDGGSGTTVSLTGFDKKYQKYAYKSAEAIANAIFEHCLWYFVRADGTSRIVIEDESETIDLDDVFEAHMHSSAVPEEITIKDEPFELLHIKLRTTSSSNHGIAFCADSRLVLQEKLSGKIPGLHGRLTDNNGDFVYVCYVSANVLNESARPERTSFDLVGDIGELFADTEISWEDIRSAVSARASAHLESYLEVVKQKAHERVHTFVSTKAPRYRPIMARIPEAALYVDPDISDKELDLTLHKHLADIESQMLATGHDLMKVRENESADDYQTRLNAYLKTAEDIKKSDLANYVAHRKVILDLLESAIQRKSDGRYAREDVIHSLIMPMRSDSTELLLDSCNLWLVDERLAFHDYLASDKPLSAIPVTGSSETKEPDIMALNVFDNPMIVAEGPSMPMASIVVVEIKRPMRNDARAGEIDDPIEQALGYLERIREGKVTTASGRPIPRSEDIPGFCYVICDITPSIEKRCVMHDLTRTSDGLGFFTFKQNFKAYVEVISFDRLINMAKERNRMFFDKLGLPTS